MLKWTFFTPNSNSINFIDLHLQSEAVGISGNDGNSILTKLQVLDIDQNSGNVPAPKKTV